jgi:hypothetical protein
MATDGERGSWGRQVVYIERGGRNKPLAGFASQMNRMRGTAGGGQTSSWFCLSKTGCCTRFHAHQGDVEKRKRRSIFYRMDGIYSSIFPWFQINIFILIYRSMNTKKTYLLCFSRYIHIEKCSNRGSTRESVVRVYSTMIILYRERYYLYPKNIAILTIDSTRVLILFRTRHMWDLFIYYLFLNFEIQKSFVVVEVFVMMVQQGICIMSLYIYIYELLHITPRSTKVKRKLY